DLHITGWPTSGTGRVATVSSNPRLQTTDLQGRIFSLQAGEEFLKRGQLAQVFEMRIDAEERPAGETGVDGALQPRHGLFRVPQDGINAGDLMIGVVDMTERTRGIQRFPYTLQGRSGLVEAGIQQALQGNEE